MGDLDKLIVTKGLKNCPNSNKLPYLVTLVVWNHLYLSIDFYPFQINIVAIVMMGKKRVSKTFHLLMISLSLWDLVSLLKSLKSLIHLLIIIETDASTSILC